MAASSLLITPPVRCCPEHEHDFNRCAFALDGGSCPVANGRSPGAYHGQRRELITALSSHARPRDPRYETQRQGDSRANRHSSLDGASGCQSGRPDVKRIPNAVRLDFETDRQVQANLSGVAFSGKRLGGWRRGEQRGCARATTGLWRRALPIWRRPRPRSRRGHLQAAVRDRSGREDLARALRFARPQRRESLGTVFGDLLVADEQPDYVAGTV